MRSAEGRPQGDETMQNSTRKSNTHLCAILPALLLAAFPAAVASGTGTCPAAADESTALPPSFVWERLPGLEWRACGDARIEGGVLEVSLSEPGDGWAEADIDLSGYDGRAFEISATVAAEGVVGAGGAGLRVAVGYVDATAGGGGLSWPSAPCVRGDFGPADVVFTDWFGKERRGAVLRIGLQGAGGRVRCDLSTVRIREPQPLAEPRNRDYVVEYPERTARMPLMRGAVVGGMGGRDDWDTLQGWGGLWRFAYSHTRAGLGDREIDSPHFFDLAADPLAQAAERAIMCLFLRGDLAPFGPGVALWVTDESAAAMDKTYMGAPPWCDDAWRMRVGSCLSPEAAAGLRVMRREEADPAPGASAPGPADLRETPLSIDRRSGTLSVSTPRTCGGFAESGRIDAGPLSFEIGAGPPVPTTLWASSLDGRPIASSSRLLLTHLTDVQGEGSKFADARRQVLLERGTRPLVCAGSAAVELRLDAASAPDAPTLEVFALDSSGHRIAAIPAAYDPATGVLRFTASTRGPDGQGVLCYEIAR